MIYQQSSFQRCWQDQPLTLSASVVRLDVSLLDLTVLDDKGITLAARLTENGSAIKVKIKSLGEFSVRVGEETNTTLLLRIEGLSPGLHAGMLLVDAGHVISVGKQKVDNIHESIVDGDDKDTACILQSLEVDVAWNVRLRACGACEA